MGHTFFDKHKVSACSFFAGKGRGPQIEITAEHFNSGRPKSIQIPVAVFGELALAGLKHIKDYEWPVATKPHKGGSGLDHKLLSHEDLVHLMNKGVTDLAGFEKTRMAQLTLEREGIGAGCPDCEKIARKLGLGD